MKRARRSVFIALLLTFYFISYGSEKSSHGHEETEAVASTILKEIRQLKSQALFEIAHHDNTDRADTLFRDAISRAETSYDTRAIIESYIQYLENSDIDHGDHTYDIIDKTVDALSETSDEQLIFDAFVSISRACLKMRDEENSLTYAMKLIALTSAGNDLARKGKALMIAGKSLDINGLKKDAFENYLKSQELIQQIHASDREKLQFELDGAFFDFYLKIRQFDKAADHKLDQIRYLAKAAPESDKLMWLEIDICRLRLAEDKKADIKPNLEKIIHYSEEHELLRLFHTALSIYRTLLLNTQDMDGFKELFIKRYPENLVKIRRELPSLFHMIKAYSFTADDLIDSANIHFLKAEEEVIAIGNDIYSSNFYRRYGEYLLDNDRSDEALDMFLRSYEYAEDQNYQDFMLASSKQIEMLTAESGQYEMAYQYGKVHNELDIKKKLSLHEDDMLRMELKSQSRQMEFLAQKHEEERRRKFNIQYTIIVITIISLFVILILVSSMTVPEWLIEMMGFISILFFFEFLILLLDNKLHHMTHGAPLYIFLIKIAILIFLFPLHHIIEHKITNYMKEHKMIGGLNRKALWRGFIGIWPWMRDKEAGH